MNDELIAGEWVNFRGVERYEVVASPHLVRLTNNDGSTDLVQLQSEDQFQALRSVVNGHRHPGPPRTERNVGRCAGSWINLRGVASARESGIRDERGKGRYLTLEYVDRASELVVFSPEQAKRVLDEVENRL